MNTSANPITTQPAPDPTWGPGADTDHLHIFQYDIREVKTVIAVVGKASLGSTEFVVILQDGTKIERVTAAAGQKLLHALKDYHTSAAGMPLTTNTAQAPDTSISDLTCPAGYQRLVADDVLREGDIWVRPETGERGPTMYIGVTVGSCNYGKKHPLGYFRKLPQPEVTPDKILPKVSAKPKQNDEDYRVLTDRDVLMDTDLWGNNDGLLLRGTMNAGKMVGDVIAKSPPSCRSRRYYRSPDAKNAPAPIPEGFRLLGSDEVLSRDTDFWQYCDGSSKFPCVGHHGRTVGDALSNKHPNAKPYRYLRKVSIDHKEDQFAPPAATEQNDDLPEMVVRCVVPGDRLVNLSNLKSVTIDAVRSCAAVRANGVWFVLAGKDTQELLDVRYARGTQILLDNHLQVVKVLPEKK